MKPHVNAMRATKKRPANMKRKEQVNLGAMSVDDFMQKGFDTSDESEEEVNVGGTRNGRAIALKKSDGEVGSLSDINTDEEEEYDTEEEQEEENDEQNGVFGESTDEEESEADSEIGEAENDNEEDSHMVGPAADGEDSDSVDYEDAGGGSGDSGGVQDDEGDWTSTSFSHKKAMAKLRKIDPEFYKYLQENDKDLLNFDESDSDDEKGDDEAGGIIHKPPENLEVGSDESDFEGDVKRDSRAITLLMVEKWETELRNTTPKSCETVEEVIHAFHAVVVRISSDDDDPAKYIVTGSSVFNAVVQLCVLELQPALKRFLRIPEGKHVDPTKNKAQWAKVRKSMSQYLTNLIKLLEGVSSSHILAVMLKHLHQMVPFAVIFPKLLLPLLKKLVALWSTNEETVRVVAFLCLLRLTTHSQNKLLDKMLKMMYLSFVRNSKFVSPSTLPAINFMRRSLVEIFALDLNVSYQHAFLYIRQLAIHLRNAITLHKKENIQAVANWQFIHSLHLWADLLGATVNKPQLQPLVYPLVQVTLGLIKLVNTSHYFALRFHCTQILIELSKRTCTFIPILPFLLEVLTTFNFNKNHTNVSMKPVILTFIVRSSKHEIQENGFKDCVIDTIYKQILEYLSNESNSISFPDFIIPVAMQIKEFLKVCKVSNYCRKMKQLLDKIMENAQFVEKERQKVNFNLSDQKSIAAWESQLRLKGTPLSKFYDNWSKLYAQQQAKKFTQNDKIGDFNLPTLKKRPHEEKPKSEGPVELFPSDDSDGEIHFMKSEDDEEPKKKRGKRGSGKSPKSKKSVGLLDIDNIENLEDDNGDILEDLKLEDLQ